MALSIIVTHPKCGASRAAGQPIDIEWKSEDSVCHTLEYSLDGGSTYVELVEQLPGDAQNHLWKTPKDIGGDPDTVLVEVIIRVSAFDSEDNVKSALSEKIVLTTSYEQAKTEKEPEQDKASEKPEDAAPTQESDKESPSEGDPEPSEASEKSAAQTPVPAEANTEPSEASADKKDDPEASKPTKGKPAFSKSSILGTQGTSEEGSDVQEAPPIPEARPLEKTVVMEDSPKNIAEELAKLDLKPTPPQAPPEVYSVSPTAGSIKGNTLLVISGRNFADNARVEVGGAWTEVIGRSETEITISTPEYPSPGYVDIRIIHFDGADATLRNAFEYRLPPPTIASVEPDRGPLTGGTPVTIYGDYHMADSMVYFENIEVRGMLVGPHLQVVTPAGPMIGPVRLRIIRPDGEMVAMESAFSFERPLAPIISEIQPSFGPSHGGNSVVIRGTHFLELCRVEVDGVDVAIKNSDRTSIQIMMPPHKLGGKVNVTVIHPDGQQHCLEGGYTYDKPIPPPQVDGFRPSTIPVSGGVGVTILGQNFQPDCRVDIGGFSVATNFITSVEVSMMPPPRANPGPCEVKILNPDGQSTLVVGVLKYVEEVAKPAIASIDPTAGTLLGGTKITVRGSNFQTGCKIIMEDHELTPQWENEFCFTAITPLRKEAGWVQLRVVNPDGYAHGIAFEYEGLASPKITSLLPTEGSAAGGSKIAINGDGFHARSQVYVNKKGVKSVFVSEHELVFATESSAVSGMVDVEVRNPDGQNVIAKKAFKFLPVPAPILETIDPKQGPTTGGMKMTLIGKNFNPDTIVLMDGKTVSAKRIDASTLQILTPERAKPGLVNIEVRSPAGQGSTMKNAFQYNKAKR
jgi:hypothetical protein